jgi:hypothetical protein
MMQRFGVSVNIAVGHRPMCISPFYICTQPYDSSFSTVMAAYSMLHAGFMVAE